MAFIRRNVQRSPSIRVALIDQRVGKCGVLLLEDLEALHVVSFFCGHPNLAEKLSLALLFKRLVVLIIKL